MFQPVVAALDKQNKPHYLYFEKPFILFQNKGNTTGTNPMHTIRPVAFILICCILCSCGRTGDLSSGSLTAEPLTEQEEKETVTAEEIYQQAVDLLCFGDADYRRNQAAKELFEIIRGYRDSEGYLKQICEVCISVSGERIHSEFVYDEYGHIQIEKGNPYYETDEGEPVPEAIRYEYTEGKITREICPNGETVLYEYDEQGRIAKMDTRYANGETVLYTYTYETDDEGKIIKRTAFSDGKPVGERTSEYLLNTDGTLSVLQHEEVPGRSPSGKDCLLSFNKKGQLVRVDYETRITEYTYGYVWMPEHDPDEEFVYEHRLQVAYF